MAGDEAIRAPMVQSRQALELTQAESWRLPGSVPLGRIVFTRHAMPAIGPVSHLAGEQTIIIRSQLGAAMASHASTEDGAVVCYQAGDIDPVRHTGWSVIATGMARLARDPAAVARCEQMLEPRVERQMDYVIAVRPQVITGLRLAGRCR